MARYEEAAASLGWLLWTGAFVPCHTACTWRYRCLMTLPGWGQKVLLLEIIPVPLLVGSKPWRMICISAPSWSQVNARTFSRLDDEVLSLQAKPPPKSYSHPARTFGNFFTRSSAKNAARSPIISESETNYAHTWSSGTKPLLTTLRIGFLSNLCIRRLSAFTTFFTFPVVLTTDLYRLENVSRVLSLHWRKERDVPLNDECRYILPD